MQGEEPNSWSNRGWKILNSELPKQVFQDGVNFEGSIAYHRLVTELFLLPALYRKSIGLEVKESYVNRLRKMAEFIRTYSRTDGSSPLWGDADDGRPRRSGAGPHQFGGRAQHAADYGTRDAHGAQQRAARAR